MSAHAYKNTQITSDIVVAYSLCPRKAFLIGESSKAGKVVDYIRAIEEELNKSREAYFKKAKLGEVEEHGKDIESEDLVAYVDDVTLSEVTKTRKIKETIPILIVGTHKYSKQDKLQLAFIGHILSLEGKKLPTYGYIINRATSRTRVKLSESYKELEKILVSIRAWRGESYAESPTVVLNRHCSMCKFEKPCREKAVEEDHLSLLNGIQRKEIVKFNQKGIFTVNQLSYTFRARKNKNNKYSKQHIVFISESELKKTVHLRLRHSLTN